VFLETDNIVKTMQNIGIEVVDKTADTVTKSVDIVANLQFGLLVALSLVLFVFFKYRWDKIFTKREDK